MFKIEFTSKMKKDVKRMKKRGKDLTKLVTVLNLLKKGDDLPTNYRDHQLTGNLNDFRECHIEPDWLLLYKKDETELILYATTTGTHSDLFDL